MDLVTAGYVAATKLVGPLGTWCGTLCAGGSEREQELRQQFGTARHGGFAAYGARLACGLQKPPSQPAAASQHATGTATVSQQEPHAPDPLLRDVALRNWHAAPRTNTCLA